jgi:hypothetical protein
LSRRRSELTERSFAHVCETGGGRRAWVRGVPEAGKLHRMRCAAFNLALLLRKVHGLSKPRSLGKAAARRAAETLTALERQLATLWRLGTLWWTATRGCRRTGIAKLRFRSRIISCRIYAGSRNSPLFRRAASTSVADKWGGDKRAPEDC